MQEIELLVRFKIFFLLTFIFIAEIFPQSFPDKKVDSLLRKGIDYIIIEKYADAEKTFNYLDSNYTKLPFGKIYLAAVKIAEGYDYREPFNSKFIERNLDEAESQSEKLVDSSENNPWYNYLKALSNGYYAYYEALNHNWLSAFSKGYDSMKEFEDCISLDSNFYDAYTALGTFNYWSSNQTRFFQFLPFVHDESKLGIEYLKKAVSGSGYNSYLAINALIWIYIHEKDYKDAQQLAEKALKEYPGSRFFMWGLARSLEGSDPQKSIKIYQSIYDSYKAVNKLNPFHEILLKYLMAKQYASLGKKVKALKLCNEILNKKYKSQDESGRMERRLKRVEKLKEELLKS